VERTSIIIIGAGAAGLAAAKILSEHGIPVTILEARDRPGGRIQTILSRRGQIPIELGAEFIHGARNHTWKLLRAAKLATHEVPDRHWLARNRKPHENKKFWDALGEVMERIDLKKTDRDFLTFVNRTRNLKPSAKWLATEYVEGFHAAPAAAISIRALAKSEAAAEQTEGTRQFRVSSGYSKLTAWLVQGVERANVSVQYDTVVTNIDWQKGAVDITTQTADGARIFAGSHALVTVPLGVLKGSGPAAIHFNPVVKQKEQAVQALEMGEVIKITLQFRSRFWPVANFGFVHSDNEFFPTWWADERGDLLTGWSGGPRAKFLAIQKNHSIIEHAIRALSSIFDVEVRRIRDLLTDTYLHNWSTDPFTLGAYSFTPVGQTGAPAQIAKPVKNTLFFAGEATDSQGEQGTVHGAIASGQRAAFAILKTLSRA